MPGWLLINAIGKSHPDATKDLRGTYKRGDVIDVHPPTWEHGTKEVLPKFYRLLVNDQPVPFLKKYLLAEEGASQDPEDPMPRRIRRRAYRIVLADLPPPVRNKLNTTGEADINWRALRGHIQEKKSGITEEGRN